MNSFLSYGTSRFLLFSTLQKSLHPKLHLTRHVANSHPPVTELRSHPCAKLAPISQGCIDQSEGYTYSSRSHPQVKIDLHRSPRPGQPALPCTDRELLQLSHRSLLRARGLVSEDYRSQTAVGPQFNLSVFQMKLDLALILLGCR